jgi:hypothetical protein
MDNHKAGHMSDVDDLVAAMVKGDPGETVPLDVVTAMAEAALIAGWRPTTFYGVPHGVKYLPAEPEDTDGR